MAYSALPLVHTGLGRSTIILTATCFGILYLPWPDKTVSHCTEKGALCGRPTFALGVVHVLEVLTIVLRIRMFLIKILVRSEYK